MWCARTAHNKSVYASLLRGSYTAATLCAIIPCPYSFPDIPKEYQAA